MPPAFLAANPSDAANAAHPSSLSPTTPDAAAAPITAAAHLSNPQQYALQLAEAATGQPVVLSGYTPLYDALLAAAPPAALSPEGLALAHKQVIVSYMR